MNLQYYKILGFSSINVSKDQIKSAYRALSKEYHPDRNQGDKDKEEKFKQINEAYEVLFDDAKRAEYDKRGYYEEDEAKAVNRAKEEFVNLFTQIFEALPDDELEEVDIKSLMLEGLKESMRAKRDSITKDEHKIERFERFLRRVKSKQSVNLIADNLKQRITNTYRSMNNTYKQIRTIELIAEIAKDYEYDTSTLLAIPDIEETVEI